MLIALSTRWRLRAMLHRGAAFTVNVRISIALLLTLASPLWLALSGAVAKMPLGSAMWFAAAGGLVSYQVYCLFIEVRSTSPTKLIPALRPLPNSGQWGQIHSVVDSLSLRILGPRRARPGVMVNPLDDRSGAYAITIRGKHYIVLSLGFLVFWSKQRSAAEAVLGHELAHVAQRDSALWRWGQVWNAVHMEVNLPIAYVSAVVVTLFCAYILDRAWVDERSLRSVGVEVRSSVFGMLVSSWGSIAVIYGFNYTIRKMRHRSEYLADLAAAAFVGPQAINEALVLAPEALTRPSHPSTVQRRRAIQLATALADPGVPLLPAPGRRRSTTVAGLPPVSPQLLGISAVAFIGCPGRLSTDLSGPGLSPRGGPLWFMQ
jgi:Zn-dependent protease with chaperone function